MKSRQQVIPIKLNDKKIFAEVSILGGEEDVASKLPSFETVTEAIEDISSHLSSVFDKVKPDKASVEFGIQLTLESGKLAALIVKGQGSSSMKVTLEWNK